MIIKANEEIMNTLKTKRDIEPLKERNKNEREKSLNRMFQNKSNY